MNRTVTMDAERKAGTRFSGHAADARAVFVVGTCNDWNPTSVPLMRAGNDTGTVILPLAQGRYEFNSVIDGRWFCEPACDEPPPACPHCVTNSLCTMNRVIEVAT
jgi:hypothetical protein